MGRAIATKGQNPDGGPGTPVPRGPESFKKGEKKAILGLDAAAKRVGWDHPIVRECVETLIAIARGEITGRYCGERLRAVNALLDRLAGTPRQSAPGGAEHSDVDAYLEGLLDVGDDSGS